MIARIPDFTDIANTRHQELNAWYYMLLQDQGV